MAELVHYGSILKFNLKRHSFLNQDQSYYGYLDYLILLRWVLNEY